MTLTDLRELLTSGKFHHATVKLGRGRCWDGLYIYEKGEGVGSFRGYKLTGAIPYGWGDSESPEMTAAMELVKSTGWSFGAYGEG
jgi:hypothetical protein